jgi:hypothetical protein
MSNKVVFLIKMPTIYKKTQRSLPTKPISNAAQYRWDKFQKTQNKSGKK